MSNPRPPTANRNAAAFGIPALRRPVRRLRPALNTWWVRLAAIALLYASAAIATLRPTADGRIHFATIDNFLYLYTLEWERSALLTEPHRFFEGLGFFGMGDSMFYTHLLLGGLPVYVPIATVFGPIAGLNALVILSPVLNAAAAAGAAWLLLGRWWPAVLAGFVFGFAPVQQEVSGFLHMLIFWWTPLAAALWFWFLRRPVWWKLSGAWLCVFIQFATGVYLGFIALVTLLALIASTLFFRNLPQLSRRQLAGSALGIFAGALPFLPLLMGYVGFWLDNQEVRTLNEARRLSQELPAYMPSATEPQLWFQAVSSRFPDIPPPFPNMVPTILAAFGLAGGIAYRQTRSIAVGLAGVGILMFMLSLGPELWWNGQLTGRELPFATAHELIPGFASLRIASLFTAGMTLPMALLAAIAVDRFSRSCRMGGWRKHALAIAILGICVVEFARMPALLGPPPDANDLQAALAESADGAVAFVPSGAGFLEPDPFMRRMWWSLNGGRQPVVSGYSGYLPRGTRYLSQLIDWTDASNRPPVMDALLAFGIRTIVLDREYLSSPQVEEWQAAIQAVRPSAQVLDVGRFVVNHLGPDGVPSAGAWADVEVQPVLQAALPDSRIVVPVVFHNRTDVPWRPPPGRRTRSGEFVWESGDGTPAHSEPFRLHVPPLIPAKSSAAALTLIHARTPAAPGDFRLALMVDGERIAIREVEVRAQQSPQARHAVDLRVLAQPVCVRAGEQAFLHVSTENTGSATWDGTYRLGTHWAPLDGHGNPSGLEGRLYMLPWQKIPIGSGVVFRGLVDAPREPGHYKLTLGMVEEGVEWFGQRETLVHVFSPEDRTACVGQAAQ